MTEQILVPAGPDAGTPIRRVLLLWDGWRRRKDVTPPDLFTAIEALRVLLPFEGEE
jgi:hypothetical protein